jgi:RimJ/RimL family protein N-acetyltransferase
VSDILEIMIESDAESLKDLFLSIGMSTDRTTQHALGFIKWVNSKPVIGRKLVINGALVGGGQLTVQKYPHAAELGFWVHRNYQRHGYGYRIAALLINYAFAEMKLHRVFAKTSSTNPGSLRILEKTGMKREGVLRDVGFKDSRYCDEIYYGILQNEGTDNDVTPN